MRIKLQSACFFFLLAAGWGAVTAQGGAVIREGDAWRYFKGTSTPSNNWTQVGFGDGVWNGPAPSGFGFADYDDATVLADMTNGGYASVYIRTRFVIANTGVVTHLTLGADYDDGFVAYLNGTEVARRNMPAGAVNHTTLASTGREASRTGEIDYRTGASPQEKEFIDLSPGLLVNGTNVLAVSGHNSSLTSSDFSLIVELYTNVTLLRGPILQMPNPRRLSVMWRTDASTDSAVDYGLDTSYGGGTATDTNLVRQHIVDLPVLAAGSTYYYRVRSAGVVLATNTFRAPALEGQAFRFAAIGDFGSPTTNTAAVANQVAAANVDFLFSVGDNIYQDGQPGSFDAHWFRPYSNVNARAPVFTALGNHDVNTASGTWELAYFYFPTNGPTGLSERNYSFDYGNAHVVVLDSNSFDDDAPPVYAGLTGAGVRDLITRWLTNDLASTTQTWKFVVYHHPGRTSVGSHNDEALVQSQLEPIIGQYRVNFVFQGHNHWYERINPINGVNYITTGGGGFSLHTVNTRRDYSAQLFNDRYSMVVVDINGPSLALRALDQNGLEVDSYRYDLDHPFSMDGLIDSTNWVRASNGMRLNAAIRGYHLYVAAQDAGEGSDHFIYLNNQSAASVGANWGKAGQVMQWSAFLSDENDGAFKGWFGASQNMLTDPATYRAQTSGLNNNSNAANGVLEGTLQLVNHFGSFPTQLWMAVAPYATADGGALLSAFQVPAGNGNGNVESNEFLVVNPRDIALDLPVAEAGGPLVTEAGFPLIVNGSASTSPSGLPLSFVWQQVGGPSGFLLSNNVAVTTFIVTQQVAVATTAVLRLTIFDTRFDTQDVVSITVNPVTDTDGDGLSDLEEQTGLDNVLTWPNPGGRTSNANLMDTDGDGQDDAREAAAGTDPQNAGSFFEVTSGALLAEGGTFLQWSSVAGRVYSVFRSTNLWETPLAVVTDIPAFPPLNSYTVSLDNAHESFFFLKVKP